MTLGLTDTQLRFVTACCSPLPVEKRDVFLRRMVAHLQVSDRLRHPTDADIEGACRDALAGLVHAPAA